MVRAAALALVFLAGCDREAPADYETSRRLNALEQRILDLQGELQSQADEIEATKRQFSGHMEHSVEVERRLFSNDQTFLREINARRAVEGLPAIPYEE